MDEICVAKFDVYECRKSDRASALSGAQLNICAAQTPEFPDTIPTIIKRQSEPHLDPRYRHALRQECRNKVCGFAFIPVRLL